VKRIFFLIVVCYVAAGVAHAQYTWTTNIVWSISNGTTEPVQIQLRKRTGSASTLGQIDPVGTGTNYLVESRTIATGEEYTFTAGHTATVAHTYLNNDATAVWQLFQLSGNGALTGNSYVTGTGEATGTPEWVAISTVRVGTLAPYANGEPNSVDFGYISPLESNRTATPDFAKTLWKVTDETLTANLFREGIDKMTYVAQGSGGGGGGGGSTDNTEEVSSRVLEALAGAVAQPEGTNEGMASGTVAASTEMSGVLSDAVGSSSSSLTFDGGIAPELTFTLPALFGGFVFDLNPFSEDRLGPIASWFRSATEWLTVILLGAWIWGEIEGKIKGLSLAQQAKGNTVAGTGGQLTALLAAGAITAAVVSLTSLLVSWGFGSVSLETFRNVIDVNPLGSMASDSLWMIDQLLPTATLVTCCAARLGWRFYSVPLFSISLAVVRFVVP